MTFGNKESCLAYIECMRAKCRKRYDELYSEYINSGLNMTEECKKEVDEIIKMKIELEFGKCYL